MKIFYEHKLLILTVVIATILYGLTSVAILLLPNVPLKTLPAAAITTVTTQASSTEPGAAPVFQYLEVVDGCNWAYVGSCVNMRSGPGESYPVVMRLRTGIVLKVADTITSEGKTWYKILFDGEIRYPERVSGDWYVSAENVHLFTDEGDKQSLVGIVASSDKRIVVDLSQQTLSAYDGDQLFMQASISTGLEFTPTPAGTFTVFKKTPSRYMQGPLPGVSDQVYDLPGVPWNLYFTKDGAVIHGAYWHDKFGQPWSHGCVNLPLDSAHKLYLWADVGTSVIVRR